MNLCNVLKISKDVSVLAGELYVTCQLII